MIFVYYEDDWPGNGGIGLEKFETAGEAEEFVMSRMAQVEYRRLDQYTVINGEELGKEVIGVVKEVRFG